MFSNLKLKIIKKMSMEEKINEIEKKLTEIDNKLIVIINLIEMNNEDCKKMSSHIDFVEETYGTLKHPLEFFKNKFNYLTGGKNSKLPQLER